jgi:hypothetical protein
MPVHDAVVSQDLQDQKPFFCRVKYKKPIRFMQPSDRHLSRHGIPIDPDPHAANGLHSARLCNIFPVHSIAIIFFSDKSGCSE